MKTPLRIPLALTLAIALVCGGLMACNTSQQTVTFKTISSLDTATVGAYTAYLSLVVHGQVSTNSVSKVDKAFEDFQSASRLALTVAHANSNALAPDSLIAESAAVLNLIQTVK